MTGVEAMDEQSHTTELSREGVRRQREKVRAARRRKMIGVPALLAAAGIFGYGVWMLASDDGAGPNDVDVQGTIQENTTTVPDPFPEEPDQLPGVDIGDPSFEDSPPGDDPEVDIGTAVSVVREDPDAPTTTGG